MLTRRKLLMGLPAAVAAAAASRLVMAGSASGPWRPVQLGYAINGMHPLAKSIGFLAVCTGDNNFVDLVLRRKGALTGTPAASSATPFLGKSVNTASGSLLFSGESVAVDNVFTMFGVAQVTSSANHADVFCTSSANSGWRVGVDASRTFEITSGGVAITSSSIVWVAGAPYAFAVSQPVAGGTISFATCRLDTGQVQTSTAAGSTAIAPNGTYQIGDNTALSQAFNGQIAMAGFSRKSHTTAELTSAVKNIWDLVVVDEGIAALASQPSTAAFTNRPGVLGIGRSMW